VVRLRTGRALGCRWQGVKGGVPVMGGAWPRQEAAQPSAPAFASHGCSRKLGFMAKRDRREGCRSFRWKSSTCT
jgi:hypothetical protein